MDAPRIDYAPALPSHRRRRLVRRVLIGSLVVVLAALAVGIAPSAWRRVQISYWQHRAMSYAPAGDEVVYEENLLEAAKLRAADRSLIVGSRGEVIRFAPPWDRFYQLVSPPGGKASATLFCHERRNTRGERRLVVVSQEPLGPWNELFTASAAPRRFMDQPFPIACEVFIPGTLFENPQEVDSPAHATVPALPSDKPTYFRWYAGQADPQDASHFTIRCVIANKTFTVHGWLRDDDRVEFETVP